MKFEELINWDEGETDKQQCYLVYRQLQNGIYVLHDTVDEKWLERHERFVVKKEEKGGFVYMTLKWKSGRETNIKVEKI